MQKQTNLQNDNDLQLNQHYVVLRTQIDCINNIIEGIKNNIYNYLNDKHNNKLNISLDIISQPTDNKQQQQILFDLFKRAVYYFDEIQFDLEDEFWQKTYKLSKIDFKNYDQFQIAKIYKNLLHLILQYQIKIIEKQKKLQQQKKQAQRMKKIMKQKQRRQKQKDQQKKKKQQQQRAKQQQLIEDYDKMTYIISIRLDEHFKQVAAKKSKVAYAISKQRRVQKERQKIKQSKFSTYRSGIKHPKKPRKPKSY